MPVTDLSLASDPTRTLTKSTKQLYKNCLAFAVRQKTKSQKYTDACAPSFCGFKADNDFNTIIQCVSKKIGVALTPVGTSLRIPTTNAPLISKRNLIGVGHDKNYDLHFYVVTETNGDGQGLCGIEDARTNTVLPCRLRTNSVIQYSGTKLNATASNPDDKAEQYTLLGFVSIA